MSARSGPSGTVNSSVAGSLSSIPSVSNSNAASTGNVSGSGSSSSIGEALTSSAETPSGRAPGGIVSVASH